MTDELEVVIITQEDIIAQRKLVSTKRVAAAEANAELQVQETALNVMQVKFDDQQVQNG